jgi:flagellar biosynthetic protein FlhB
MAGGSDNRSEKPTQRRLRKAREKGQIARSREVPAAAVLLAVLITLFYFGQNVIQTFEYELQHFLSCRVPSELTQGYLFGVMNGVALRVAMVMIPILLAAFVIAITANVVQGGLVFSTGALGFHLNRLSPKNGLSKIFSKNGLVELCKSILTLAAVCIISYQVISKYMPLYPRMVLMDVRKLVHWTACISYEVFIRIAVALVILAIFDYWFQKYRFIERLKMTKQEVKEDFKETEGDPTTKGRIRRIQREMARRRMMADVPTSDVVITNPTHYAVALAYKMDSMEAPKVVAKGVGFLALKIKELAQEHGVPLVENKPLAQTLYKSVEIGDYIPGNLYRAVAEILAYVYKARSALGR